MLNSCMYIQSVNLGVFLLDELLIASLLRACGISLYLRGVPSLVWGGSVSDVHDIRMRAQNTGCSSHLLVAFRPQLLM